MTKSQRGMYPEYRVHITEDIIKLMNFGESFRIEGFSGTGKTRYIKYFCTSEYIFDTYLKPNNLIAYYINLDQAYKRTPENLLEVISNKIGAKSSNLQNIEERIQELSLPNNKIYLIFDHCESLNEFPENSLRLLKAIRTESNKKLSYALSYKKENPPTQSIIECCIGISNLIVEIGPMDSKESIQNIKYYAEAQNLEISDKDIIKIAEFSHGVAKNIRRTLMHMSSGKNVNEAISATIDDGTFEYKTENHDELLANAQKSMTKSEFIIFSKLYSNKRKIITRDELALLLNPENNGYGVSNESIDQLISRVRKAIAKADIPVDVLTKRGIGYYIE